MDAKTATLRAFRPSPPSAQSRAKNKRASVSDRRAPPTATGPSAAPAAAAADAAAASKPKVSNLASPDAGSATGRWPRTVSMLTAARQPCCVCKDEKSRRDECMLFSTAKDPAADCKSLVDQYKSCMLGYGFKV
ncbi:cytochrome C oxidase copper chaperone (COX17) domain-containing protein [Purpureocillium lavendulum]|uniref:Cytochrome C oxidase copper chaperone (COX17) domain-containing protein n=1 Tax=Purpureocillium lavendulum TaxID=1247861 RepID=A0AB34G408_9HYPO|nr:cytochrome C oxidase copper chaperone (COX17) domain-containing protein [Purpureocillium lavendulum]